MLKIGVHPIQNATNEKKQNFIEIYEFEHFYFFTSDNYSDGGTLVNFLHIPAFYPNKMICSISV